MTSLLSNRGAARANAHTIAVAGLAAVFAYQGLVPKLLKANQHEVAIWESFGFPTGQATRAVRAVGAVEASFALATVAGSRHRWPFLIALATMPGVVLGVAKGNPSMLTESFNPISDGIAVWALAAIALLTLDQ